MAHPRTRPGGHLLVATGEKITSADLGKIGTMAEQTAYHLLARLCQNDSGSPFEGFFGEDCDVSITAGLVLAIAPGVGFYYDTADVDAFGPCYKPIVVSTAGSVTLGAHNSSPRVDIVCLAPLLDEDQSESRSVKDGSGTVTAQSVDKRARWSYTALVVAGTPAAVPVAPATPAGYLLCATVVVPATSGAVVVHDARPRLALGQDLRTDPSSDYAANFVPSGGLAVTAGTGLQVRVAKGEAIIQGYRYRYARENLTITAAHATLDRYDAVVADADGTLQILVGTPGAPAEPSPAADQVGLAVVEVLATATTVTVTDSRDSSWLEEGSIRDGAVVERTIGDGEVTGAKFSVVPVIPELTVNTAGSVAVQLKDVDGNNVARAVDVRFEILNTADMEPSGGTANRFSTITTGTAVSGLGQPAALVTSNASGVILAGMVFNSGDLLTLIATPIGTAGYPSRASFTIP